MDITHNQINGSIDAIEVLVAKGQPYAKANKERQGRAVLRDMREKQSQPPLFKDIWLYFKMWVRNLFRGKEE
jgi:hypothetical protein